MGVNWGGVSHTDLHLTEITLVWRGLLEEGKSEGRAGGLEEGTKMHRLLCARSTGRH